ncbi:hypothetical protein Aph01nite_17150 [Acrocarpospora phusangensis]|uniref:SnoaL-like domain-containing protein n=1 Tax=Acrocarpospora phusangensis TaxID=1070424 RepID=A0A919UP90_9ACTN|nr:nuclear transport factor 2 family protein [Acrocarpospora phusangensis]GIH23405.1 hypothetical protein Aph01nite_17150 [Acrocarpospora phusangensis]
MTTSTDLVRSYLESLRGRREPGFEDALRRHLTEDAICVEAEMIPWGGTWTGIDGYLGVFDALQAAVEKAPAIDPARVRSEIGVLVSAGDRVFREFTLRLGGLDGTEYVMPGAETYTIKDGRIAEIRVYFQDTAYLNQILSADAHGRQNF